MNMRQDCPLCAASENLILWQDDFCRVVLLNDQDYPAYCRVELISHIKEMTDLPPAQRARMMKVVFSVEAALRQIIQPNKINLASLGNKTPHVHWHVIPRFKNDKHYPHSHWGEALRHGEASPLDKATINKIAENISALIACALA